MSDQADKDAGEGYCNHTGQSFICEHCVAATLRKRGEEIALYKQLWEEEKEAYAFSIKTENELRGWAVGANGLLQNARAIGEQRRIEIEHWKSRYEAARASWYICLTEIDRLKVLLKQKEGRIEAD